MKRSSELFDGQLQKPLDGLSRFIRIGIGSTFGACLASANGITYTCDATIIASGTCNTLNTTIAGLYDSTFTNANASLFIEFGSTGLASSTQFITNVAYNTYATALSTHQGDSNDMTAVNSLGGLNNNPVASGDSVAITSALAQALGLTSAAGSVGITTSLNVCALGSAGCYNGIITVTNAPGMFYYRSGVQGTGTYDFFTAVEHETDEMLGTGSCITGQNTTSCPNGPKPATEAADLFRWASPGTRSFASTANGTTAYFAIDGGNTNVATYNNTPNGADYGDWNSSLPRVQNAFGAPGVNGIDITNDGGSEIKVLDAVGYNLASQAATPEPGSITLLGSGLAFGVYLRRRRRA